MPGDKLPSERELAGLLNAGRSSVREALRAMELLGLIETRRGEGTFILDFRKHQLVEILSEFILDNARAKKDVVETKRMLEIATIFMLVNKEKKIGQWLQEEINDMKIEDFFENLVKLTDNFLLLKIWRILSRFEQSLQLSGEKNKKETCFALADAINKGEWQQALNIYQKNTDCIQPNR